MGKIDLSSTFLKSCSISQRYVQYSKVLDLSDYKSLYLQTAKEYIDKMSVSLGKLSKNVSDKDALNDLHISSHSLLGQSQVMKFANMAGLSAVIKRISRAALEGRSSINSDLIPILKESVGLLNLCISQIKKTNKETDLSFIVKRLDEYIKQEA